MNQREFLLKNIIDGKVKIYFILSLERSNSTTLQLALSQAPEIDKQINLPFNNYIGLNLDDQPLSLETIAKRINSVIDPLIKHDKKIRVIIHEHFCSFENEEHMNFLKELSEDFVFCFRDPKNQFFSSILVSMNQIFLTDRSICNKNLFKHEDLLECLHTFKNDKNNFKYLIEQIIQNKKIQRSTLDEIQKRLAAEFHLQYTKSNHIEDVFNDFIRYCIQGLTSSWKQAVVVLNYLQNSQEDLKNIIMIDGNKFLENPMEVLLYATKRLKDLSFCQDMINNWQKFTGKNFTCYVSANLFMKGNNIWNGESQNSSGIKISSAMPDQNKMLNIELLNADLASIFNEALEVYDSFRF